MIFYRFKLSFIEREKEKKKKKKPRLYKRNNAIPSYLSLCQYSLPRIS